MVPLEHLLILAITLFVMGLACILVRRGNLIMMLVGTEIMLNAAILAFVAGSAAWGKMDGQLFALFIIAMTSAEVSLALAMVVYLHRRQKTLNADAFSRMKG